MSVPARAAGEGDAILGILPGAVYEPSTAEEAAEVVRESARDGRSLAFIGGGTDLERGFPPERLDAVVRTGRLARVLEHAPSDQIVIVEAGVTLASLQETLARHGQRLALDPPLPGRATAGGIVAANAFGPRRARFGSVRDLIIGISFVRADGTHARGGGKVVKNVAGFDLPKLMVGSLGTLGLITSVTFRLHPLPEEDLTIVLPGRTAGGVRAVVSGIRLAQIEPTSVAAVWRKDGRFDIGVRFEGFRAGVAEQRQRLEALCRGEASGACEIADEPAARAFWQRHDAVRTENSIRGRLALLPARIETLADEVLPELLGSMDDPGFVWYATLGLGFFSGSARDTGSASAAILAARRCVAESGTLTLDAAPGAIRERVDVWGPAPAALTLMRTMKERLDPQRRFAPGRFVGGI